MPDKIGLNHEVLPFSDYKKGRAPTDALPMLIFESLESLLQN